MMFNLKHLRTVVKLSALRSLKDRPARRFVLLGKDRVLFLAKNEFEDIRLMFLLLGETNKLERNFYSDIIPL